MNESFMYIFNFRQITYEFRQMEFVGRKVDYNASEQENV